MEVSDCNCNKDEMLMLCIVVESEGAVKCEGVKEHKSVACLLCLEPLVLTDQEFHKVL